MFDYKEAAHGISRVRKLFCILIEVMVSRTIPVLKALELYTEKALVVYMNFKNNNCERDTTNNK